MHRGQQQHSFSYSEGSSETMDGFQQYHSHGNGTVHAHAQSHFHAANQQHTHVYANVHPVPGPRRESSVGPAATVPVAANGVNNSSNQVINELYYKKKIMEMLNVENTLKNELLELNLTYNNYSYTANNGSDILENIPIEKFYNFLKLLGVLEKDMKLLLKLKQISINKKKNTASTNADTVNNGASTTPPSSATAMMGSTTGTTATASTPGSGQSNNGLKDNSNNYTYQHDGIAHSASATQLQQMQQQASPVQLPPFSYLTNAEQNSISSGSSSSLLRQHLLSPQSNNLVSNNGSNSCEKLIMRIKKRKNLHNPYNYMTNLHANPNPNPNMVSGLQHHLVNHRNSIHQDNVTNINTANTINNNISSIHNPIPNPKNNIQVKTDPTELVCKQCNEHETPEWRRGPYGNKTLCNACGLYYSKLIKKFNSEQANIIMRYKKMTYPSDRKIPIEFDIPESFILHLKNDTSLDLNYFSKEKVLT